MRMPALVALSLAAAGSPAFGEPAPSTKPDPFPLAADVRHPRAGRLEWRSGEYQGHPALYGLLFVPENRTARGSRLIHVPVMKIASLSRPAKEPLFYLFGGPGATNIHTWWPEAFFRDRDFVQVGYRGVDGWPRLQCPGVGDVLAGERPLSPERLEAAGRAMAACLSGLREEGVDLDGYTMLDVVDDLEAARRAMGYGRIHLLSHSYGTQLAYLFTRRHPRRVARNLMVGASAPGYATVWDPAVIDEQLRLYGDLCREDAACRARTDDLAATVRHVLATLPRSRDGPSIDPDKVRVAAFQGFYDTGPAVRVFDAFLSAQEGDLSGVARLSSAFDERVRGAAGAADAFCKLIPSALLDPRRGELRKLLEEDSVLGSPQTELNFGLLSGVPDWERLVRPVEARYRTPGPVDVPTLVLNGELDFSSPPRTARERLLPLLRRGRLAVVPGMGHNDVIALQREAFFRVMDVFYSTGEVDTSAYVRPRLAWPKAAADPRR
jgi:pimeloyl-ACP methyl ester carboxylesterase